MYTFSVSVLLQALLVVSISSAADHGNYRKKLLLAFAWLGSACVMCYIFVSKSTYVLGALLAIVSNTSFGASFVLLNSFLPLLGPYLLETPTGKIVEWLVRRFRVHEFNVEAVLALFLPYQESAHFTKMLSILQISCVLCPSSAHTF